MKILQDENIPLSALRALQDVGHDVRDLRGTELEGAPDETLWQIAQNEKRLLISTDKGFASNRYADHFGILIVRLKQPNRHKIQDRISRAMSQFPSHQWRGLLVVCRDEAISTWRTSEV